MALFGLAIVSLVGMLAFIRSSKAINKLGVTAMYAVTAAYSMGFTV